MSEKVGNLVQIWNELHKWQSVLEQTASDLAWLQRKRYRAVIAVDFSELFQYMHEGSERSVLATRVLEESGLISTMLPGTVHEALLFAQKTMERIASRRASRETNVVIDRFLSTFESDIPDLAEVINKYKQVDPALRSFLENLASGTQRGVRNRPWERLLDLMNQEEGGTRPLGEILDWRRLKSDSEAYQISLDELQRQRPRRHPANRIDSVNFGVAWSANLSRAGKALRKRHCWLLMFAEGYKTRQAYENTFELCRREEDMRRMLRGGLHLQVFAYVSRLSTWKKKEKYVRDGIEKSKLILDQLFAAFPQLEKCPEIFTHSGHWPWPKQALKSLVTLPRDVLRSALEYERDYIYPLFEPTVPMQAVDDAGRAEAVYELLKGKTLPELLDATDYYKHGPSTVALFREVMAVLRHFVENSFPDPSKVKEKALREELELLHSELAQASELPEALD